MEVGTTENSSANMEVGTTENSPAITNTIKLGGWNN